MAIPQTKYQPFWTNPVIAKDMRVRMRGSRAFWNQGLFLALLCIISGLGYAFSTQFEYGQVFDPVAAQQKLQEFYYWIFETLAFLVTLVAPALTAVSIITERKMMTLDLLVATPMTAIQMLSGKLISSFAFIGILLCLSVPPAALCVILGGASISDVLQSYAFLAIDGLLLTSIGLWFSCSAKQHAQAVVGTYGAIIFLLLSTYIVGAMLTQSIFQNLSSGSHTTAPLASVIFELNPFFATAYPGFTVSLFGLNIPAWIGTALLSLALCRLFLTGAALRLGMYSANLVGSLRRQVLLISAVIVFVVAQAARSLAGLSSPADVYGLVITICCTVFAAAAFFLPGLFVPVADEDGPTDQTITKSYSLARIFSPDHSGSLPYFQLWLFCVVEAVAAGVIIPTDSSLRIMGRYLTPDLPSDHLWSLVFTSSLTVYFFLAGLGFLFWSSARRAAWLTRALANSRAISFFTVFCVAFVPWAAMLTISGLSNDYNAFAKSAVRYFWILYPLDAIAQDGSTLHWHAFIVYGLIAYVLGAVIYAPWWSVTPGSSAKRFKPKTSGAASI